MQTCDRLKARLPVTLILKTPIGTKLFLTYLKHSFYGAMIYFHNLQGKEGTVWLQMGRIQLFMFTLHILDYLLEGEDMKQMGEE